MCYNVNKDTLPLHRQAEGVIIEEKNAFQSLGLFYMPNDFTPGRIERHLIWNKKIDPSSFVSTFDKLREFQKSG